MSDPNQETTRSAATVNRFDGAIELVMVALVPFWIAVPCVVHVDMKFCSVPPFVVAA